MLLNFTLENYKSYKEKTTFSMLKAPRIKDMEYSLLKEKIGGKDYTALCSSVIYGSNASGKSNIIDALATLKNIVDLGHIRNTSITETIMPTARTHLELVPFAFNKEEHPVYFGIEFIYHNVRYQYDLKFAIEKFLSSDHKRSIIFESLKINNNQVFERNVKEIKLFKPVSEYMDKFINGLDNKNVVNMFNQGLVEDELFLTNGFKNISKYFSQEIFTWFKSRLMVIQHPDRVRIKALISDHSAVVDEFTNQIAKQSGITGADIVYVKKEESGTRTCTCIKNAGKDNHDLLVPIEVIESNGTANIVDLSPIILDTLRNGATLVVDELDNTLHSMVMMNIINLFHNDEVNINKAQLIFNTHNVVYLDSTNFRRDEIRFVEKNASTHESSLYSLSDFGTVGTNAVRPSSNYMINYLNGNYGATVDVDYTDIYIEALKKRNTVDEKSNKGN